MIRPDIDRLGLGAGPGPNIAPTLRVAAGASPPTVWTGSAQGGIFIQRHFDNNNSDPSQRLVVDDQQSYQAHFTFSFQLQSPGILVGDGKGQYDQATWHLQGTYANQSFTCDPPITADPFTVAVGGSASNRTLALNLDLPDAVESLVDYYCGANFTAYGSSTQYLRESLQSVGGNATPFEMTSPGSKTLTNMTETSSGDFTSIIKDSSWTVSVAHPCAGSNYGDPSTSAYINQYDAGTNLNLPVSSGAGGARGGNACGPSSLVMLINAIKEAAGSSTRMDLKDVYTQAMTNGWTADGQDNLFDWEKAEAWAKSKGYAVTLGEGIDFIDTQLASGALVLASTLFSSKAQSSSNPYGGGHVVLFTGRTANGDYIVSDPAGDYFSSDTGHYGSGKCGSNTIYPEGVTNDRLYNNDGSTRPALAIQGQPGADPPYLVLIGWFSGTGPSPYNLWVQDAAGGRAGFLPDGMLVQEIPGSEVRLDPQYPSDPDAPSMPAPNRSDWPQSISLPLTQDPRTLTISVQGRLAADYRVEVYTVENGTSLRDASETGHVAAGQTLSFPVQATGATTGLLWEVGGIAAIAGVAVAAVVLWVRRRRSRHPPAQGPPTTPREPDEPSP